LFPRKWISLQRGVLAAIEEETYPLGREEGAELKAYFAEYEETLPDRLRHSAPREILGRIERARVVIVGDYHTHQGSANMVNWLLLQCTRRGRRCMVFLEALPNGFEKEIESYMAGSTPEDSFLSSVGYGTSFGFEWSHYRQILISAARLRASVTGINIRAPAVSLAVRDGFAAAVVAEVLKKTMLRGSQNNPLAIILAGEKHLAPPHLPQAIEKALAGRRLDGEIVTVHRNAPSLYFALLKRGYDGTPAVFDSPDGRFLVQDTSPLTLKARDMVWFCGGWGNPSVSDPEEGAPWERNVEIDEAGLMARVLKEMSAFLGVRNPRIDDFHVFTGRNLGFLDHLAENGTDERRFASLKRRALRQGCLYVPESCLAYMREIVPAHLGLVSALHIAARHERGRPRSPFLENVRGALGATLLDPCFGRDPLIPIHPACDPRIPTAAPSPAEAGGIDLGRRVVHALAAGVLSSRELEPLFGTSQEALGALERIRRKGGMEYAG